MDVQNVVAIGTMIVEGSFAWPADPVVSTAAYAAAMLAAAAGAGMGLSRVRTLSARYASAARAGSRRPVVTPVAVARFATSATAR